MKTMATQIPQLGDLVKVRQRRYLVEGLRQTAKQHNVLSLSCIDDDDQGRQLEVYWEYEHDREIINHENWEKLAERDFDPPGKFAAYLNTLRWNCVTATNPRLFQSPFRSGIKIDAYQLEPLRRALEMPRVNLFIADDVGLGKTIEAGLIMRELLLRKKISYVVVIAPPSMLAQWKSELDNRFGLNFDIVDRKYIGEIRKQRGFSTNPWSTNNLFIISQRLIIDDTYSAGLRDFLRDKASGTLMILDEAHHAAPSTGSKYATDTEITRSVRGLSWLFEHRLFLSATPHNGHSNSFSALLEILDPHRFTRGIPVDPKKRKHVMVRRLKEDLRKVVGDLPERKVIQEDIDSLSSDTPEIKLFELLTNYISLREGKSSGKTKSAIKASHLVMSNLQQRLLSSTEAFFRTLKVHKKSIARQNEKVTGKMRNFDLLEGGVGSESDKAEIDEELLGKEQDMQAEQASRQGFEGESDLTAETKLLNEMEQLASQSRGLPDEKIKKLISWIQSNQCAAIAGGSGDGKWSGKRVIIFTEWEDTKRYIREQLLHAIEGTDLADKRIEVYQGSTSLEKREQIKRRFNTDPAEEPLRILICTDAAREGLNLQKHCNHLFHYDVPWNPSRMEQRNGRIDRKLQSQAEVFCHYFFYKNRPEDKVLEALVTKTERIRKELGSLSQVVEDRLADDMKGAVLKRGDIDQLYASIKNADLAEAKKSIMKKEFLDDEARETQILQNISEIREQLDESTRWLGYSRDQFKQAINLGLEIIDAPKLEGSSDGESKFQLGGDGADLTQRTGWSESLDQLRLPRTKEKTLAEWRTNCPVRPIVFDDVGSLDDSVVHLHLEHKLSKRLLGRLMTQGFAYDDLSRACFTTTESAVPKVVLIARYALYGHNASRLHEEIVTVSAKWVEPKLRKNSELQVEDSPDSEKTREGLFKTITTPSPSQDSKAKEKLHPHILDDVEALRPFLVKEVKKRMKGTEKELKKRGKTEATSLKKIIESQIKAVEKFQDQVKAKDESINPYLPGFDELSGQEKRQVESDQKHWEKRLGTLRDELDKEPNKVLENYEIKASRIEPVGIVYLWPESN